jgi:hypothetical protein
MHDKPLTFWFRLLIEYFPVLRVESWIQAFNSLQQLIMGLSNIAPHPESHLDWLRQVPGFSDLQPGPCFQFVVNGFRKPLTRLLVGAYIDKCTTL